MSQSKYAKNIVKRFGHESARHKRTPATTHIKLTNDDQGIDVDQSLYRRILGAYCNLQQIDHISLSQLEFMHVIKPIQKLVISLNFK